MRPPRVATLMLRVLLPAAWREPILGDLHEEWMQRPSRARYWDLALRSIVACWFDRLRPSRMPSPRKGDRAMSSLLQDVRYGLRLMWRNPGFTLAALVTLGLGIGANSAIFSMINLVLLEPLPYRDASRVAFVLGWDVDEGDMRFNLRRADFLDLQRESASFTALAAYGYLSANLTGSDVPDRVQAYRVTDNTFDLLGVPAERGRVLSTADRGRAGVAVISHALWQRRFGGDAAIIGRTVDVDGEPTEIVGVMPPRFEFPVFNFKGDLWLPWDLRQSERGQPGARGSLTVIGRLRDGVSYAQAQAEVDLLMRGLADRYPESNRGLGARVIEMGKLDDQEAAPAMLIVLAAVAMVLLLACANVANLLLARGAARQRELAVRAAIGASRMRIGRQLLIEGVLLAFGGAILGALVAFIALAALRRSLPDVVLSTQPNINELGVDGTTLLFTLALALVTSVVFGVLPAWRGSHARFEEALKQSASLGGSRQARRLRSSLVVAEVALATVLMIAAGLLARSYATLTRITPGFEPAGVMTMAMTLPAHRYGDAAARRQFFERVLDRVAALPGVTDAAFVNVLPFSTYDRGTRVTIDGQPPPEPGREPSAAYRIASAGYHRALRIPLLAGRFFDATDTPGSMPVAIVNETFARRYLGASSAIGRRIRFADDEAWFTIVGMIGDVRHSTLTGRPNAEIYVPMTQADSPMMMLAARTPAAPQDLAAAMQQAIREIDAAQPVYHTKTLETLVGESAAAQRMSSVLVMLFGVLALALATIGVYGVVSYGVSRQTREFGVRLALGATPRNLLEQVLRAGGMLIGLGIAIGIGAAVVLSRALASLLIGVSATDPFAYATAVAVLALTGLVACVVPARRAAGTAAISALRED